MTYFTNNPSFGFNNSTTLAQMQNPAGFLIISDAARPDGALARGSLTPQYVDPVTSNAVSYVQDMGRGHGLTPRTARRRRSRGTRAGQCRLLGRPR